MEPDEHSKTIAKGALWGSAAAVAFKIISFVYTIIIARLVTQEQVGIFYFAVGLIGMFNTWADFGLISTLSRYVPFFLGKKDIKSANTVINLTVIVTSVTMVIIGLAIYFFAHDIAMFFNNPMVGPVLQVLAVYSIALQSYAVVNSLLVALKMIKESSLGGNLQNLLKLVLTLVLLAALGANAMALAVAMAVSYLLAALYMIWESTKVLKWTHIKEKISLASYAKMFKEIFPFGITITVAGIFSYFMTYIDRILLSLLLVSDVNAQIGIYSMATTLAIVTILFGSTITNIFLPVVSELVGASNLGQLKKTSATVLRWCLFATVPVTVFVIAFSGLILRMLYGAAYEPGWFVLALFSAGMFILQLGAIQRSILTGMRYVGIELIMAVAATMVNIIINVLLIPEYGINGAAAGGFFAFVTITVFSQYYARKYAGFEIPKSIYVNIFAGLVVLAILAGIQAASYGTLANLALIKDPANSIISLILNKTIIVGILSLFAAAGALAYLSLVNLLHLYEQEDAAIFRKIIRKTGLPDAMVKKIAGLVFWG